MFEKTIVVDCAGHMLGRVASVLAKEIMNGQKVVAVRTEELNISGSLFRHKRKLSFCVPPSIPFLFVVPL